MSGRTHEREQVHEARSFAKLPDAAAARSLLSELAYAPCRFSPVSADRPIALYGAGDLGGLARDFLRRVGRDVALMIDRDAVRIAGSREWSDLPLLAPGDVATPDKDEILVAVSVVKAPYVPVERSLRELGFGHVVPFYDLAERFRHLHPLSNGWFAAPLTAHDERKTADVLGRWDDDMSRAHHLQFLAWRRLRQEWTFLGAPPMDGDRFFISEVTAALGDNESLLDAGAHLGRVTEAFIRRTEGLFRDITAVEPDPASRAELIRRLASSAAFSRISVLDVAVGAAEGAATFHDSLGYASQISPTGRMPIRIRPIDALGVSPTFVKLHLEGGELAALIGARQTLLDHRPIVAATVYHNDDGIWRTADWLMETLRDYRFLFRLDSWCGTGAVVYAVPSERSAR